MDKCTIRHLSLLRWRLCEPAIRYTSTGVAARLTGRVLNSQRASVAFESHWRLRGQYATSPRECKVHSCACERYLETIDWLSSDRPCTLMLTVLKKYLQFGNIILPLVDLVVICNAQNFQKRIRDTTNEPGAILAEKVVFCHEKARKTNCSLSKSF